MKDANARSNWFVLIRKVHQDALELNKRNKFSEIQKKLITPRLNEFYWRLGLSVIVVIIVATFYFSEVITSAFRLNSEMSTLVAIVMVIVATVGTVAWIQKMVRNRINKILNGRIENDLGKYYFDYGKKKYIALWRNHSLEPLFVMSLLPGAYKFYYLKQHLILLSAEPCASEAVPFYNPETDSLSVTLQRTIGFDNTDLSENRNKQLSERQKSKLKRKLKKGKETVHFVFGYGSRKPYGEVSTAAAALDLAMNFLGNLPNAIYYFTKTVSPAEKYFYYIDKYQLAVPSIAWISLIEGLLYKAYFLEGTNELLSIEVITEDNSTGDTAPNTPLRRITVTADAVSKTYGDADPVFTYQITSGSLAPGDTLSGSLSRVPGENVGTYAIGEGTLALSSKYALIFAGADLIITARPITVTAAAQTKVYGNHDPSLIYQITRGSLAFGDAFTGALTRAMGENVGTHAITQGALTLNSNYTLTFVGADLTIHTRSITITADAKSKTYGDADPALTYQLTSGSLAFSDAFTGSLTRDPGETIGAYGITQGTVALNSNYSLTYVGANLTIGTSPTRHP